MSARVRPIMTPRSKDALSLLHEQARAWQVRLNSGRVTPDEAAAFKRWCQQSPEHARAWRETSATWSLLSDTLARAAEQNPSLADAADPEPSRRQTRLRRRAFLGGALAASATGLLALRPPLDLWPSVLDYGADYRTDTGEQRALQLAEGLTVQMNTQTRLNWSGGNPGSPGIELLAGEAEIVTAHRPLTLSAGAGQVQTRQARLNVRMTDGSVCVTCLDGRADVRLAQSHALIRGQQLIYDDTGLRSQGPADAARVSAWRSGMLSFVDVPLSEVVRELNRYRPGKILVRSDSLARRKVRMEVSIQKTDLAVTMLRDLYGAQLLSLPGGIVFLS